MGGVGPAVGGSESASTSDYRGEGNVPHRTAMAAQGEGADLLYM
jgi:hypothetical protein